jgi:hypothetical protein
MTIIACPECGKEVSAFPLLIRSWRPTRYSSAP